MYLRISLKLCERCGILWFRTDNSTEVYCSGCARRLQSLPRLRRGRYRARPLRTPHHHVSPKTGGAA